MGFNWQENEKSNMFQPAWSSLGHDLFKHDSFLKYLSLALLLKA